MTKTIHVGTQTVYVLPKPTGGVIWWGDHRIELDRSELNALAEAFADVATPQMEAVAA